MSTYSSPNAYRASAGVGVVVLIVAALAGIVLSIPSTEAQIPAPVYTIEGIVYDPDLKPLSGATVIIKTSSGSTAATKTTDSAGKYSQGSLGSGTYNVSVSHSSYRPDWVLVGLTGTDPTVQQNFRLQKGGAPEGVTAVTLKGIVRDEGGDPLEGVFIEVWNYYEGGTYDDPAAKGSPEPMYYPRPSGNQYVTAKSGPDGAYALNLFAGSVSLTASRGGFDRLHANFEMREDRSLDLPMRKAEASSVELHGTVKGSDGSVPRDAWVSVSPDYESKCDGDVCYGYAEPSSPGTQEGDVYFYYESPYSQYNSTQVNKDGSWSMMTMPGRLIVNAYAPEYVEDREKVDASEGGSIEVNLVLERIPADSVRVHGKVVDAESGEAIPWANVNLENQRWGQYNYTMSKEDGSYEFYTKPGYTLITASAYQYYVPCDYASSSPEPAKESPSEGDGPSDTAGASDGASIREPYPYPDCDGSREREHDYMPRVDTFAANESQEAEIDFKLERRPSPDAVFIGYAVNASSDKAIPGATISFYNERTRDWGQAVTGEDGSYKIKVHAGYYTVRAYAEHFFDASLNVEIGSGDEKRVDVMMEPGEKRYGGYCCYYMGAEGSYAKAGYASGGPAPPMATVAASSAPAGAVSEDRSAGGAGQQESGQQAYQGEAGNLGPYHPYEGGEGGGTAPGAAFGVVLGALVAAILVRRRAL